MEAFKRGTDAYNHGDGHRCQQCGRSDVPLEVHHVNGDATDNRLVNLTPLCRVCHHEVTFPG